ncbi:MAG: MATE family efflux transporter [Oscillospiraceae bacterium]|nr:MATE family efflux transporter [Oscillospiraceae bacterium]
MSNTQAATRMTEGPIAGQMIRFALPLFIGNLFQQLYNTADALIVGNLIGSEALAAVSATGTLVFLLVSLFAGIASGAGVVVSRYFGARDPDRMRAAIHTVLALDLMTAALLTLIGTTLTPAILRLMGTPADVMARSTAYIRIYFAGSLGLVLYNSCRGIMQAVGDSRHPLYYLVTSSVINVFLDLLLIGVFHMDVEGAALATILAQFVSVILCLRRLMTTTEEYRVRLREIRCDWQMLKLIVQYGLPAGLQNSVIAIANVVVQANINAFGTMAVAGCGAYGKIEGFAFLPITSFTIALTTFVGQNLGGREYERAKKGAGFGVICAILLSETIGLLTWLGAPVLIRAFTQEPEAIAFGVGKARICSLFYCLLAASHGLSAVLRGAGKAVIPMVSMLSFWCVVRVAILHFAVPVYQSINTVNWVYPITWALSTVFLAIYFFRADWLHSFERQN